MSVSFLNFRYFLLLLLLPFVVACAKKESDQPAPAPAPTTGSITGSVSPADALKSVTASMAGGLTFVGIPTATGTFAFDKLAPGSYTLSFEPNLGYLVPASRTIVVVAGSAAAAGVVTVASDGSIRSGTAGWTASGQTYTTTQVTGGVQVTGLAGNALSLVAIARSSTGVTDAVNLFVGGFTLAPGTYNLIGSPYTSAAYTRTNNLGQASGYSFQGGSAGPGASGTVTIGSYSAATGTLAGTFAFSAPPANGTTGGNLVVTSGTFSLRL